MTQYLISFEKGAMDHIPDEDMPDVSEAVRAVVQEAKNAGMFVFTGGLDYDQKHAVVATDGIVTDGPYPGEQGTHRRRLRRRRTHLGGSPGVGREGRRRLPLCARRPRVLPLPAA
jgi:hypothetical protein